MTPDTTQAVVLTNVSWETYERLVEERGERRWPRFHYDRGVTEVMGPSAFVSPTAGQAGVGQLVATLVYELSVAWEIDVRATGSARFSASSAHGERASAEDLRGAGFEPDGSFYFSENAARVRGMAEVDPGAGDPPPDLIFEVLAPGIELDKLPIYARLGVPEVWRYGPGSGRAQILGLVEGSGEAGYRPVPESRFLSPLRSDDLARFVGRGQTADAAAWAREVREWAR